MGGGGLRRCLPVRSRVQQRQLVLSDTAAPRIDEPGDDCLDGWALPKGVGDMLNLQRGEAGRIITAAPCSVFWCVPALSSDVCKEVLDPQASMEDPVASKAEGSIDGGVS